MSDFRPAPALLLFSPKLAEAVEYARGFHTEARKGSAVPYMAHLLGVAALVMEEAGGPVTVTEAMVLAALLHDVAEDHGGWHRLAEIRLRFGPDVARMVEGLSDNLDDGSGRSIRWEERKQSYLVRLATEPDAVVVISAADKLYNAKSMLDSYREVGPALWKHFHRGGRDQLWYFRALRQVFATRVETRCTVAFSHTLDELIALVAATEGDAAAGSAEG